MKNKFAAVIAAAFTVLAVAASGAPAAQYVALGDSYSSGNGTNQPNLNIFCGRSSLAYPPIVASQRSDLTLRFVACGGATTNDVLNNQVGSLTSKTAYVTITIGGNDVGFAEGLFNCPEPGDNQACFDAINNSRAKIATTLGPALDRTYATIRSRSPKAKVVVLGYGLYGESLCAGTSGVTQTEMDGLNVVAKELDAKTAERVAVAGANFTYVNAINPFLGHGICSPVPWIRGDTNDLMDDFHPNAAGYRDGYAPLVRSVIG